MFRAICCVAILVAALSGSASAGMREITTIAKFCYVLHGVHDCTAAGELENHLKVDWPGRAVEFRGTRVRFGGTVFINKSGDRRGDVSATYREPSRLRAKAEGRRLVVEYTDALQFDRPKFFSKQMVTFTLDFTAQGECASFNVQTKTLETDASIDLEDENVGVSCSGRIDID
jgi:hypothetical protein